MKKICTLDPIHVSMSHSRSYSTLIQLEHWELFDFVLFLIGTKRSWTTSSLGSSRLLDTC